ncbi:hypothetical protein AB4341_17165 [Vibrio breoganii]
MISSKNSYDCCFLVLLYGKSISESKTLQSILNSEVEFNNCKLVIWNNGPRPLSCINTESFSNAGLSVEVIETLENRSLSKIYNEFTFKNKSNKYIYLDDDSTLSSEYLQDVKTMKYTDLAVPLIYSKGECVGPTVDGSVINKKRKIRQEEQLFAIGSGITISDSLKTKFISVYGDLFDQKFWFYGVDTSFMYRLDSLKKHFQIMTISGFEHSLSRREEGTEEQNKFRMNERNIANALLIRNYGKCKNQTIQIVVLILKMMCRYLMSPKSNRNPFTFIKVLVQNTHPKNKKNI